MPSLRVSHCQYEVDHRQLRRARDMLCVTLNVRRTRYVHSESYIRTGGGHEAIRDTTAARRVDVILWRAIPSAGLLCTVRIQAYTFSVTCVSLVSHGGRTKRRCSISQERFQDRYWYVPHLLLYHARAVCKGKLHCRECGYKLSELVIGQELG